MKIAVMLTAVDNMSAVVQNATDKASNALKNMTDLAKGQMMLDVGGEVLSWTKGVVKESAKYEETMNKMRANMLDSNNNINELMVDKIGDEAQRLSSIYANSSTAYMEMFNTFKTNRIKPEDVLGGIGEATAQLADYFERMDPAKVASFISGMKNDFGVQNNEMIKLADLMARMKGAGVGMTGEETVLNMQDAMAKASLGLSNLGLQGFEQTKQLAVAMGYFISRKMSAATVGTSFNRMELTISNPDKLKVIEDTAKQFGVTMNLMENGKFIGWQRLIGEFEKLHSLSVAQISQIMQPFGGQRGVTEAMAEFLANHGADSYQEYLNSVDNQASLPEKLAVIMKGTNYRLDVLNTNLSTLNANLGHDSNSLIGKIVGKLDDFTAWLSKFTKEHTTTSNVVVGGGMIAGSVLGLAGLWALMKWYWKVALEVVFNFIKPRILGFFENLGWLLVRGFQLLFGTLGGFITSTLAALGGLAYWSQSDKRNNIIGNELLHKSIIGGGDNSKLFRDNTMNGAHSDIELRNKLYERKNKEKTNSNVVVGGGMIAGSVNFIKTRILGFFENLGWLLVRGFQLLFGTLGGFITSTLAALGGLAYWSQSDKRNNIIGNELLHKSIIGGGDNSKLFRDNTMNGAHSDIELRNKLYERKNKEKTNPQVTNSHVFNFTINGNDTTAMVDKIKSVVSQAIKENNHNNKRIALG